MATDSWVLLLTADPFLLRCVNRIAARHRVRLSTSPSSAPPGAGPPALVLIGRDRAGAGAGADVMHPPVAGGAELPGPRWLLATGPADDELRQEALDLAAEQVILLPDDEHLLGRRLAGLGTDADPGAGPGAGSGAGSGALTIGVIGGCGGAGASVLAAALARTAARTAPTLLVEVDRLGGGADLLLGAEDEPGLRWPDLASARGNLPPGSLSGALPVIDGLHVLATARGGPGDGAVRGPATTAVLGAARAEFTTVVLDLPRHLDEAARAAVRAADTVLLVLPSQLRATAAARRLTLAVHPFVPDLRLVLRECAPGRLSPDSICSALGLPLAGVLRPEPRLSAALERGEPPGLRSRGPLARFCRHLMAGLLDPEPAR